jgi:hypothetical protein
MNQFSLVLSASLERSYVSSHADYLVLCLTELSSRSMLNVPVREALEYLDVNNVMLTSKRSEAAKSKRHGELKDGRSSSKKPICKCKPPMLLPFCGIVEASWCQAVRFNHGLHTQCTKAKQDGSDYCATCLKQSENSSTDKPPYGDIRDRSIHGLDYRDPKGKRTIPYANVAKKLNLDLEKAKEVAGSMGWSIPEEQFVERKVRRGRPKSAAVSDSESEGEPKKAKKRGRPKKAKIEKKSSQDDLIAKLVAEASEELLSGNESDTSSASTKSKAELKAEKKAAKQAEKEAAKPAKQAEKEAAKAAKLAEKEAAKAAKQAEKEAVKAAKQAEKEAAKAVKLAEKEAAKAAKQAEKEAAKAAKQAEKETAKAAKQSEKEVAKETELDDELETVSIESEADSSDDEDENKELDLPTKVIDGETYLFDEDGQYGGVENLILSMEGTPVGIYDKDEDKILEVEFEEDDEE